MTSRRHRHGHDRSTAPDLLFDEDVLAYRLRYLGRRPRLALASMVAATATLLQPHTLTLETRALVAFDVGAALYLAAIWFMMFESTPAGMASRARIEDEGKWTVLTLGSVAALAVLISIGFEMQGVRELPGHRAALHVALSASTIILAWLFMNTLFALHYAHEFYATGDDGKSLGGLQFPGHEHQDYWDFVYFSFVLGMTFQVSDVQITRRSLRRLAAAHGVLAFFFNVVILALVINISAGLL